MDRMSDIRGMREDAAHGVEQMQNAFEVSFGLSLPHRAETGSGS